MANLNIAEHRLPQDGRARVRVSGKEIDIRVATMPTMHGEFAILRLLEHNNKLLEISQLGLSSLDQLMLEHQLNSPYGLIIVTGPTGSGKTTTLASILARLNDSTRKILTIEDPVEYDIPGVCQSQIKPLIGLTFATSLRAFLRQDPDIIMVGEMRDSETAKISIQASLTGHLVLTTLHTNTAASAITRLIDMGVEPFLIGSSLLCIIAQRLLRILCLHCKRSIFVDGEMMTRTPRYQAIGIKDGNTIFEPVGCERCAGTGYRGRRAVFEVLEVNKTIRHLITTQETDAEIERVARMGGMTTMIEDGLRLCLDGVTSVDEVFRRQHEPIVMPLFQYKALDADNRFVSGEIEAANSGEAMTLLDERGLAVLETTQRNTSYTRKSFATKRLSPRDITTFISELALVLRSGVPLTEALSLLEQGLPRRLGAIVCRVRVDILSGSSLMQALQRHPEAFPDDLVAMVRVAETGGCLDAVLEEVAIQRNRSEALFDKN